MDIVAAIDYGYSAGQDAHFGETFSEKFQSPLVKEMGIGIFFLVQANEFVNVHHFGHSF